MTAQARARHPLLLATLLLAVLTACRESPPDAPTRVIDAAIERHGGELFERSRIDFTYRDARFVAVWNSGRFHYQREYLDPDDRVVVEIMDNEGTRAQLDGSPVSLADEDRRRIETAVNSVIYFGFLPHRLRDPAVRLRDLGPEEVAGEPYERVEVTFDEDGGGVDWEDRFVYWIHARDHTLDYMAYRYHRDGGGTRFRRAVNRRELGGVLVQDFENYAATDPIEDISEYPVRMEEDRVELVSMIEFEDVRVTRATEISEGTVLEVDILPDDQGEGLEVQLGMDRPVYAPGDSVRVVLLLVNRSADARHLVFPTTQRFDVLVLTREGDEAVRWSTDRSFAQVMGEEVMEPEGELRFESRIAAPETPGSYELHGIIPAQDAELVAVLPLQVEE